MVKENKRKLLIFLCLIVLTFALAAGYGFYSSNAVQVKGTEVTIPIKKDKLIVKICTPELVKVNYLPKGEKSSSTEVVANNKWQDVKVDIDKKSNPIIIKTDKMIVKIDKKSHRVSVYDSNNNLLINEKNASDVYKDGVKFEHNSEDNFYGINGYDAWEPSENGILRNSGGVIDAGKQGHCGGPFVWSTKGYGILVDSTEGLYTIDNKNISFEKASKKDLEYYVMVGKPSELMNSLSKVSGKAPMFPKWAMGFTNSEWGIDEKELTDSVNTYRAKNIPIDNYTLDFDWKAWGEDNYGEFKWNDKKFPDGATGKLTTIMQSKGMKLTGIMKPRIHMDTEQGKYAKDHNYWYEEKGPSVDYFSNKMVGDLNFANADCRKWYFSHAKNALDSGLSGWWNDEADEDCGNLQFLNMQKALYEGQRAYNNNRVWSINRNFFLGSQKYAYGMWSGDINSGFESMANQRERMLSAVNLGAIKWGMDTGGFSGDPTQENYARWIQFSAFTPIFRVHGGQDLQRQPWVFGETAEAAAKNAMQLRYKLIPYIYSYERQAYEGGVGIVKPLVFDYPKDKKVENYVDAWMFGDYMLASPVVKEGETSKEIYLPEGTWFDYFKGTSYKGGDTIKYTVDSVKWSDIPLFIKKGAIIPSQDFMNYVGEKPVKDIYLDIFPDSKETSFKYYDDDGSTYNYEKGEYFIQNMTSLDKGNSLEFNVSEKEGKFTPELKYYICKIHGRGNADVKINNTAAADLKDYESLMKAEGEGFAVGKDIYGSVTYIKIKAGENKKIIVNGESEYK